MTESRTYGPTPRRLAEARAEGRVAYTPLLAAGLACLLLSGVGGALVARSQTTLLGAFSGWGHEIARINKLSLVLN